MSDACPADGLAASGTVCRAAAGVCDLVETCDGASSSCPADLKGAAECRAAAGPCDVAETCDGSANDCPANAFQPSSLECRAAADVCDVAEQCSGSAAGCPADVFTVAGVECRASAGVCDLVESCTGTDAACPDDAKSTAECRASAGVCDVAESCDGASDDCPADALAPSTVVCRAAAGACDLAEGCTGTDTACPADTSQPNGTACDDGTACTTPDACVSGTCQGNPEICGDGQLQGGCGEQCDDGNLADGDGCSSSCQLESTPGCGAAPAVGCRLPVSSGQASLLLRDRMPDEKDGLKWKWKRGATTPRSDFGSPTAITGYQLCIYNGASALVSSAAIPAGGLCAGRPCWKATGTGFKYVDKDATPRGITRVTLREGTTPGQAKILVKGKGVNLDMPTLPLGQPVTVQLRNSQGVCWEAVFSAPALRNQLDQFKDKSD
jgi:cysteine-rich repeat protein